MYRASLLFANPVLKNKTLRGLKIECGISALDHAPVHTPSAAPMTRTTTAHAKERQGERERETERERERQRERGKKREGGRERERGRDTPRPRERRPAPGTWLRESERETENPEGPAYTTIMELGPQNQNRDGFLGA